MQINKTSTQSFNALVRINVETSTPKQQKVFSEVKRLFMTPDRPLFISDKPRSRVWVDDMSELAKLVKVSLECKGLKIIN